MRVLNFSVLVRKMLYKGWRLEYYGNLMVGYYVNLDGICIMYI